MVEAAIVFPCLVLILYWSAALSDVLVLKLKSAEAARFALWETTVFRAPAGIRADLRTRFADLRSPAAIQASFTGLLMFPRASNLEWDVALDTASTKVELGGAARLPPSPGFIGNFVNLVLGGLSRSVDSALARQRFNVHGAATARVTLVRATHERRTSPLLNGGDLIGLRGRNDLGAPRSMTSFSFQTPLPGERPLRLVFDTWKAWPKPAGYTSAGARTNSDASPMQTYPTVEEQVSAQVKSISFFGLAGQGWFNALRDLGNRIARAGVTQSMAGGRLPDVFSAERMDGPGRGPLTILPPEPADAAWVPSRCSNGPCPSQRLGDVTSSATAPRYPDDLSTMGDRVDRARYTVPYRINTGYWTQTGGADARAERPRLAAPAERLARLNEYVRSYRCRGHFFGGATRSGETDSRRRNPGCNR